MVSGTGLSLEDLEETTASGVAKPEPIQVFTQLGMFDTWPKLEPFLKRYIPTSILESDSWHCLEQRIQGYLLGR